jgi:hypothetical protein
MVFLMFLGISPFHVVRAVGQPMTMWLNDQEMMATSTSLDLPLIWSSLLRLVEISARRY